MTLPVNISLSADPETHKKNPQMARIRVRQLFQTKCFHLLRDRNLQLIKLQFKIKVYLSEQATARQMSQ